MMPDTVDASPFDASLADPHQVLAARRAQRPVDRVVLPSGASAWLVTRYDDAQAVLTEPRLSKQTAKSNSGLSYSKLLPPEIARAVSRQMLGADPPDHTRLRRLVSGAFTARRVAALRPRIEKLTNELLDGLADGDADQVDLIDRFAFPLPIQVICELLGVPAADQDSFRGWSDTIVAASVHPAEVPAAVTAIVNYIWDLLAAKRAAPADDLLSALVAVRDGSDRLTDDELASMVYLLLIAGHETTVNLIGNGVLLLLSDPRRWAGLVAQPELVPGAVEEVLRFEGPVQASTFRVATEPVELAGQLIPAGDLVLVSLLSANRDADRFADPDHFDVTRPGSQHLAFGHGVHYCLGAPLARLEGQIAFHALLDRFPDLSLAVPPAEVTWRPGVLLRGLTTLPVTLRHS